MITRLTKIIIRLLTTGILLAGVVVGLSHLILPMVGNRLQPSIEQAIGKSLGRSLHIGDTSARWHGLGPQLLLKQLHLSGKGEETALVLDEVRLDLAPLDSILQLRPVLKSAALVGARLAFQQLDDGSLRLIGINDQHLSDSGSGAEPGYDLSKLPLGMGLIDSQISLRSHNNPVPLQLREVNLRLLQAGEGFHAQGRFKLATGQDNAIRLGARINGPLARPDQWSGALYLETRDLALEGMLSHLPFVRSSQAKGQLGMQLWGTLTGGKLSQVEGNIGLQALSIQRKIRGQSRSYTLDNLQGGFRWQRESKRWRLQLVDLQIERNGTRWPKTAVSLQSTKSGRINAAIDFLRLEDIISLVMLLPENRGDPILTGLQKVQPSGDLRNLRFNKGPGHWMLEGSAEQIRSLPWKSVPSINSLSARFRANQDGGIAEIDHRDIQIIFANKLFAHPIRLKQLQGSVHWKRHQPGWQIASGNIQMSTPDFATGSRFSLSIPDRGPTHLDLQTRLKQGDVAYVRQYLPTGIMNPQVAKWLGRALVSGRIKQGNAIFQGHFADFPFDKSATDGHFKTTLEVEDVILDYLPGWPRLEQASAELRFINNSFEAKLQRAGVSASQVTEATVRINRLYPVSALELDGVVEGPLSDDLRVLTDTPLAAKMGEMASGVTTSGNARLQISLRQPLSKNDPEKRAVKGTLSFRSNRVEMEKWNLQLDQLKGDLEFDHNGIRAKALRAKALGSAIKLNIKTPGKGPKRTEIRSSGKFDIQTMSQRRLGLKLPLVEGRALWNLLVDIPHRSRGPKAKTRLVLSSNLRGVKIKLPPPLGKTAKTKKNLSIKLSPVASDKPLPVHIRLGDQADTLLLLASAENGRQFDRAAISLGGAPAKSPEQPGLWIKGKLSHFKLDPWLNNLPAASTGSASLLPYLDVNFDHFEYQGFALDKAGIKGGPQAVGWQAQIDSPQLKGLLQLPASLKTGTIKLDLDHLALSSGVKAEKTPAKTSKLDPRTLPAISLRSKQLLLNGRKLGSFNLQASKHAQGLKFDQIKITSDWLKLKLKGQWLQGKQLPRCSTTFKLEADDMGKLQKAINGSADIQKAPGRAEGKMSWDGSPMDFSNMLLDGKIDLKLKKGTITELEPGAGRVFGLLNLGALQRRLTLDFTDFLNKGFAFDKIEGAFKLKKGLADTNNLTINAPTGVINIYGRTNLIDKELDQMIEVIPDVTGTLATAGTIVAGPVVGAALFVANKVIGKELNKIGRVRYLLRGSWDDPKIFREGQKKPLSKKKTKQPTHSMDILDH